MLSEYGNFSATEQCTRCQGNLTHAKTVDTTPLFLSYVAWIRATLHTMLKSFLKVLTL